MKLISAGLEGFRRFRERSEINLDFKTIALVGPNESGKSSLLRALWLLSNPSSLIRDGDVRDLTHRASRPANADLIWALFELETHDAEAVSQVGGLGQPRWFKVTLKTSGETVYSLSPELELDLTTRKRAQKLCEKAGVSRWAGNLPGPDGVPFSKRLARTAIALETDDDVLPDPVLSELRALAESLPPERPVAKAIGELLPQEEREHPAEAAKLLLRKRLPEFLLFSSGDRELLSEYDLSADGGWPPALVNLSRIASLDLGALKSAVTAARSAEAETLVARANETLKERFTTRWSQAGLEVRLKNDGTALRLMAGSLDSKTGYVNWQERSDGMKWFTALVAFLARRAATVPPILLVDEAETHLHYDAQADLMQSLSEQTLANKVIYSTHSAGCLPEDLGAGVRSVHQVGNTGDSTVVNWIWQSGDALGLSPLLLAMGASTLAFTPARRAVISEGNADFIILPTLLRAALGREILGFQVAPGAAEVGAMQISELETDAAKVVYLVDGDQAGKAIQRKLKDYGIPTTRLFSLEDGRVLEDYLEPGTYLEAVNTELRRSHGRTLSLSEADVPEFNRPAALRTWCASRSVSEPSKRAVAMHALSLTRDGFPVLYERRRSELRDLGLALRAALGLEDPPRA